MNDNRILVGIAPQQRQIVLTAPEILDRQMRIVGDRVAPRAPAGERRLAVVAEGRHSGGSILLLAALLGLRVLIQLLLGGADADADHDAAAAAVSCGAVGDAVQRRHRLPAVDHKVVVAAHFFRSFQIPASGG